MARPPAAPAAARTHALIGLAVVTLVLVVVGAASRPMYEAYLRWAAERAAAAARIEQTAQVVLDAAERRNPYSTLKEGGVVKDVFGTDLRFKEDVGTLWDNITVTSAGPDLTFDTSGRYCCNGEVSPVTDSTRAGETR
jgi:hypothetical protein